jgi:hypothetical protein
LESRLSDDAGREGCLMTTANLIAGWLGMLMGVIAGAAIGLFFHKDDWMGGYNSYPRRLTRLGHISFFGLGFINISFAVSAGQLPLAALYLSIASKLLIVGAITMPLVCFLSAWRKPMRHFFPIPVVSELAGVAAILIGWWRK